MSLITKDGKDDMEETNELLQSCNTIKLYEAHTEKGVKDTLLLTLTTLDENAGFKDLVLLIALYLKGDERVDETLYRIKGNLE
ncbi:MAG: hypothetical protein U9N61_02245 [Euryarchaeota archaeon]|nr:hypothetical protein [Euryarchaeota archaeon]